MWTCRNKIVCHCQCCFDLYSGSLRKKIRSVYNRHLASTVVCPLVCHGEGLPSAMEAGAGQMRVSWSCLLGVTGVGSLPTPRLPRPRGDEGLRLLRGLEANLLVFCCFMWVFATCGKQRLLFIVEHGLWPCRLQ